MATAAKFDAVQPDPLMRLLKEAREVPPEKLPEFIGALESIKAVAWARLTAPLLVREEHDELLDVEAAAERLGMSKGYLYRHAKEYPFTRQIGERALRFSALGVEKYIRQQ